MGYLPSHHYDGAVLIAPKAQDAYFASYRQGHPDECFDVLDIDGLERMFQYSLSPKAVAILRASGVKKEDIDWTITILKRLRFAPRIPALSTYFSYIDVLEKEGALQVLGDPFSYFKGRKIIVRGYYDGRAIAEALQDLPNICVNYDFGVDGLDETAPEAISLSEALPLLKREEGPLFVFAPREAILPKELESCPRLYEPYAPSGGVFVLYGSLEGIFPLPDYSYPEEITKAIRLPGVAEAKRRLSVEIKYLCLSKRLLAWIGR